MEIQEDSRRSGGGGVSMCGVCSAVIFVPPSWKSENGSVFYGNCSTGAGIHTDHEPPPPQAQVQEVDRSEG